MDNKQLSDAQKLWNEVQMEKSRVSAKCRRAKFINPVVYFVFYILSIAYIIYTYCDLLIDQNAKPIWLSFDWLVNFVNDLFSFQDWLTAVILLVSVPIILGLAMKLLIHFPKKIDKIVPPNELHELRKDIHEGVIEIGVIKKSIKEPSWGLGVLLVLVAAFAVLFGIQTQLWGKSVLTFILVSVAVAGACFVTYLFGYEHGGLVDNVEQWKIDANEREFEELSILRQCIKLIKEKKFEEALACLQECGCSYEKDLELLSIMLRGMNNFQSAAEALEMIESPYAYDHGEMKTIIKLLKTDLQRNAQAHYIESEKAADLRIAKGDFEGAYDALEYSYKTSADRMVKYAYAELMSDPELSIDDLKRFLALLKDAEKAGFSDSLSTMHHNSLAKLYTYAKKYAEIDITEDSATMGDVFTEPTDIHESRERLKKLISNPDLSLEEKQALVKAHNDKYIDSVEIVNGTYYNVYE